MCWFTFFNVGYWSILEDMYQLLFSVTRCYRTWNFGEFVYVVNFGVDIDNIHIFAFNLTFCLLQWLVYVVFIESCTQISTYCKNPVLMCRWVDAGFRQVQIVWMLKCVHYVSCRTTSSKQSRMNWERSVTSWKKSSWSSSSRLLVLMCYIYVCENVDYRLQLVYRLLQHLLLVDLAEMLI